MREEEEAAAERRLPEPTGGGERGGRCGGVGVERGVTRLTGTVRRARSRSQTRREQRYQRRQRRRGASVSGGSGSGAASPPPPREPGEPAAQSRHQPHHHVPRQQTEKAVAGGERYYRPSRCRARFSRLEPHVEPGGSEGRGVVPVPSEPPPHRGVSGSASRRLRLKGRGGEGGTLCSLPLSWGLLADTAFMAARACGTRGCFPHTSVYS